MEKRRLLAIIDYQNDFVNGALGFSDAEKLDTGIAKLAQEYLTIGDPVLMTYDSHGADYLETREGRALTVPHCIMNSEGWQLYGATQEFISGTCSTDLLYPVRKSTFGIAPETLVQLKEQLGCIDEILLVGLVTNMCVLSNACVFQAAWPEAQLIVDASLCASFNLELHNKALDVMEGMQIQIINRRHITVKMA